MPPDAEKTYSSMNREAWVNVHHDFQANTIRKRRVLSFTFLAKGILRQAWMKISYHSILSAIDVFHDSYLADFEQEVLQHA